MGSVWSTCLSPKEAIFFPKSYLMLPVNMQADFLSYSGIVSEDREKVEARFRASITIVSYGKSYVASGESYYP